MTTRPRSPSPATDDDDDDDPISTKRIKASPTPLLFSLESLTATRLPYQKIAEDSYYIPSFFDGIRADDLYDPLD